MSRSKGAGGLGFRGFKDFNMALLGKHCWRLATGERSLLEQVLKSNYYPNCDFMETNIGYQPSYAWQSIVNARKLVHTGGRWIIGNGSTTRIWKDEWFNDDSMMCSRKPTNTKDLNACVSDLIDFDRRDWNRSLIFECFDAHEASKIISTFLSRRLPNDKLIWQWEKSGRYSVKSAYHNVGEINARNCQVHLAL